jgi:leucyl aminopeptidase
MIARAAEGWMQIEVSRSGPITADADALVVPLAETRSVPRSLQGLDSSLGGALGAWIESGQFEGKSGQLASLPAGRGARARRAILVGLGKHVDAEALRSAAARAVRELRRAKLARAALCVPALRRPGPEEVAQALAEGALLGHYRFDKYKTADDLPPEVQRLELLLGDSRHLAAFRRGMRAGVVIAESTNLARDLSNEPGGVATPEYLAAQARALARQVGLRVAVFGERELRQHKMGGILAVGRGSANPPRLIVLEHGRPARSSGRPARSSGRPARGARRRPTLALVGKGITFDTGGISIKAAEAMDEMKHDMSGGAAVIAALRAAALLRLPLHVVGIVPAAQNMPDGRAYLPGDIVTSANGKTIEVLNTDAEGRVVLSDALHHATSFEPDAIIDLATLTGACIVALGHVCAAVLGNDEALIRNVIAAGERTRERAWQLPLWDEYKKQIKGSFGDVKNTGGRPAGTITAAAFLSHFVGNVPWAHLDIAGTAWRKGDGDDGPKGATGFGVRLLLELLRGWK